MGRYHRPKSQLRHCIDEDPRLTFVPFSVKVKHAECRWQIVNESLEIVVHLLDVAVGRVVPELLEDTGDLDQSGLDLEQMADVQIQLTLATIIPSLYLSRR